MWAMVPPEFNGRNLKQRGTVHVLSSVEVPFGILTKLCGIFQDWKTKGIRSDQPSDVVLYVGSTCVRRKAQMGKDGETWDKVGTVPRFPGKADVNFVPGSRSVSTIEKASGRLQMYRCSYALCGRHVL